MLGKPALIAAAFMGIAATDASAIRLSGVQGSVFVNDQAVQLDVEVVPGDRVKVVSGAANIVYGDNNVVHVAPGQTVVALSSPPADPAQDAGAIGSMGASIFAAGGTAAAVGYIAGGAAIAGGAGLAVALANGASSAQPVSP